MYKEVIQDLIQFLTRNWLTGKSFGVDIDKLKDKSLGSIYTCDKLNHCNYDCMVNWDSFACSE